MKKRIILSTTLVCLLCGAILSWCVYKIIQSKSHNKVTIQEEKPEEKQEEEVNVETEYYLVQDGITEYRIVIPKNPTKKLISASEELQTFMAEATGVTLEIVSEEEVTVNEKLISLGKTSVSDSLGVVAGEEDLGTSSYKIKTVGSCVAIVGDAHGDDEAVIYGVYDFLYDAIGFKVYAADEIVYEAKTTVPLYAYDETVVPTFDARSLTYNEVWTNGTLLQQRLRLYNVYDDERIGLWHHNQVSILLPYTKYGEAHPDWYAAGGKQLCWSAGAAMEAVFAQNLIEIIKSKPNATYFMCMQQDVREMCQCSKCEAALEKYGTYAGLQINFMNHIAAIVNAWRDANAPDREINLMCLAYMGTLEPPVKKDANGNWVPYHEDVVPVDNLIISYNAVDSDFSKPLTGEDADPSADYFFGWASLTKGNLFMGEYDLNFHNYFLGLDNFGVVQERYRTYADAGVPLMYSQGGNERKVPAFSELRLYVESQLMWDVTRDYDELAEEFIEVYYKDAAPYMKKYFKLVRDNYAACDYVDTGAIYGAVASSDVYSFETTEKMGKYIEKAMAAIEPLRNNDNPMFKKLYYRVKKEYLSVLWLRLRVHDFYYTPQQLNDYTEEFYFLCTELDIVDYSEGKNLTGLFDLFLLE